MVGDTSLKLARSARDRFALVRSRLWIAPLMLVAVLGTSSAAHAESTPTTGDATLVSASGDWVGQGTDRLFDTPASKISVSGGLGHVEVAVERGSEWFYLDFAPASGRQLEDGEYTGAERYPFEAPGHPGVDVSGDGRGCNEDFGKFVVRDIHVNASGSIERFWATYRTALRNGEGTAVVRGGADR